MSEAFSKVDLSKEPEVEEPEVLEQKEEEKKESSEKTLGEALQAFPDSPNDADIEKWKQEFGEVLCSTMSETELYIFRPITRQEFVNLQLHITKAQQQGNVITNYDVEQKVVETCVLWASPPGVESLERKAGTLTALNEQIMQQSNFVNPAFASQYVVKL